MFSQIRHQLSDLFDQFFSPDTRLYTACKSGDLDRVKKYVESGDSIHQVNTKTSNFPIFGACIGGHLDVVKYLVSRGVSASFGRNFVIALAVKHGHLEVVRYLVSQGADVFTDTCPLDYACKFGHLNIVKYLVNIGVPIGCDVVTLASNAGQREIVDYLLDRDASGEMRYWYLIKSLYSTDHPESVNQVTSMVHREVKKSALLLLLNRKGTIHKDLVKSGMDFRFIKHYKWYLEHK